MHTNMRFLFILLTITLTVKHITAELRINPTSATVRENDNFVFTCSTGRESGLLIFKYNQVNVCTFSTVSGVQIRALPDVTCGPSPTARGVYNLTIERVKRIQNSNDWFCSIGASISNKAVLDVKYSSTVTRFTANGKAGAIRVGEGEVVTLSCHVDANPSGSVIIRRHGAILSQGDGINMTSFNVTSLECTETNVFLCDAKNRIGTGSALLTLYVECAPIAVYPRLQPFVAFSEGPTYLVLSVFAYPPPVFKWYDPLGHLLQNKSATNVLDPQSTSVLEIENTSSKCFGDYTVTVGNDIGVVNFTLSLQEQGPEDSGCFLGLVVGIPVGILIVLLVILILYLKRCKTEPIYDKPQINTDTEVRYQDLRRDYETPRPSQETQDVQDVEYETPQ